MNRRSRTGTLGGYLLDFFAQAVVGLSRGILLSAKLIGRLARRRIRGLSRRRPRCRRGRIRQVLEI